ncbi:MAG: energy-coupling factor ABC transporter permease [Desulfobulbaceae bacterium]|nr:energy-coupling factor ABC transporter permease [Desulfobulbaceae bacterium]
MADALLSPAVGGTMWAATAATTFYCARKIGRRLDERKIPLMGVMGAFIFAAQMINFAIPGTGSSGHLGGGLLLAVLLGPHAAFLTLASVLVVQALFFADGGLLALGANVFNLGFAPCFIAYPLLYKPLTGRQPGPGRLLFGTTAAAVIGLQLGSLGVVAQTVTSGMISLSFTNFLLLMQTIHLPIGLIEGLATAGVVSFLIRVRPEIIAEGNRSPAPAGLPFARVLAILAAAAILTGGFLSWFASEKPDGLEWSLENSSNQGEAAATGDPPSALERLRERIALLPDYNFRAAEKTGSAGVKRPDPGTTASGILGSIIVLVLVVLTGLLLGKKARNRDR